MNKIVDRKTGQTRERDLMGGQSFLYRNLFGRFILWFLIRPTISRLGGFYMNRRISKHKVKKFIKKNNINTQEYEMDNIKCFNDFFSRKIKDGARPIATDKNVLIAPCDSKLSAYKITPDKVFNIKDSYYRISDLLKNKELADEFNDGYALVFRLCVDDYHRYCYIDSGSKGDNISIRGVYHTVNPIALEHYNFFKRNHREYTILNTDNFGKVVQCEVGALMVGKIKNYHKDYTFSKGEEKGKFLFGGSTIVLLVKNVKIDDDIINNTLNGDETVVKYGEKIGVNNGENKESI